MTDSFLLTHRIELARAAVGNWSEADVLEGYRSNTIVPDAIATFLRSAPKIAPETMANVLMSYVILYAMEQTESIIVEQDEDEPPVVTGRYAIARFNLEATGRPSHAGSRPGEGRSAIREMARKLIEIEDMTTDDCTFSVGVIHGGQWVNCVSTTCTGEALSMAKRQEDLDRGVANMLALSASSNDVQFRVTRGVTRPVWEPNGKVMALYDTARGIARGLGYDITSQSSGGGSDGNFTGAMGNATLDGLGVQGAGAHTLDEHIIIESLAYRGRLMAGLLATLT